MNKLVLFLLIILSSVLVVSCAADRVQVPKESVSEAIIDTVSVNTTSEPAIEEAVITEVNLSCTVTADCEVGKQCIDGECGTIESLYNITCETKCNVKEVIVSTSDGETYTLSRGQGSYTAAGALEWKLVSIPDHCAMEQVPIPIKIIKKNYGRILGEEILTLREGETSDVVTHPAISRIAFTVKLESVNEECS